MCVGLFIILYERLFDDTAFVVSGKIEPNHLNSRVNVNLPS